MTTRQVIDSSVGWLHAIRSTHEQVRAARLHVDRDTTVADTLAAVPLGTSEATTATLATAIKTAWTAHIASTTVHTVADATNGIAAADATDLASSETLLNEAKGDVNAHLKDAALAWHAGRSALLVVSADATDQGTANALANELQRVVCTHLRDGQQALPTPVIPGAV